MGGEAFETKRMKKYLGVGIALGVFIVQFMLLPHTGMTWDEPLGFFMGRANLKFWLTGNRQYLEDVTNPQLFVDSPIQYVGGAQMYPPFPALVASATSYILAETNQLMDVWDAHHLGEVIISTAGVAAAYGLFLEAGLPTLIAAGMTVAYALYPTVWDSMRNDVKDIPLVSLIMITMYFFLRSLRAWKEKRQAIAWREGLLCALALGLSGATKPTAVVLVPIVVVWLTLARVGSKPFFIKWLSLLLVAGFVFFLFWPWLWDRPVEKFVQEWAFFRSVGMNMPVLMLGNLYDAGVNVPAIYPFVILLVQSPVELIVLALVGMGWALDELIRRKHMLPVFFVLWFWLGMLRFALPGMIIYARVRHFIDVMPAFFVLAGYGVFFFAKKYRVGMVILALILLHEVWISVRFFPYEASYFNFLVGGTRGVAERKLFDVGPSSPMKEAMEFVGQETKGELTLVYACQLTHVARFYAAPNVRLTTFPAEARYSIVSNGPSWFDGALIFGLTKHRVAYRVERSGADLMYVFENTNGRGWNCGRETESNYVY